MRAVKLIGLLIVGTGLLVIGPAITTGQPGGGFGKKGGGGFGGGAIDPNTIFDNFLARGRNFFLISEARKDGPLLTQFAQEKGITNGQITRQQYLDFYDWKAKQAPAGMAPGGFGKGPGGKGNFGGNMQLPGDGAGGPSPEMLAQFAELEFKRYDKNSDGVLNQEEMPPPLKRDLNKWDKNGDGLINLAEFKDWFVASRMQGADDGGRNGPASIIIEEEDLDKKPVVFRAGALPGGLPAWFKELDTDGDGQIAPYEWRKAGKSMDEFANWDLNGDGFITPEEALKQQGILAKNGKGSPGNSLASSGEGGFPGGGKGKMDKGFGKGGKDGGKGGGWPQRPGMGDGGNPDSGSASDGGGRGFGGGNKKKKGGGGN
jgi:hypothetical protein